MIYTSVQNDAFAWTRHDLPIAGVRKELGAENVCIVTSVVVLEHLVGVAVSND